jgi:hypothetical protein
MPGAFIVFQCAMRTINLVAFIKCIDRDMLVLAFGQQGAGPQKSAERDNRNEDRKNSVHRVIILYPGPDEQPVF